MAAIYTPIMYIDLQMHVSFLSTGAISTETNGTKHQSKYGELHINFGVSMLT